MPRGRISSQSESAGACVCGRAMDVRVRNAKRDSGVTRPRCTLDQGL